ncbi:MAG: hypothetical protein A2Y25_07360 [Candidatus Melainabacteria bacterium GWF2_37_15]|nr:MAG: hypothetical protein A2Y25_07360 [Candidatus Melainabacteria bacterium GWF2_37_15]
MLKNKKLKELISQYISKYNLSLKDYNVLVPIMDNEPLLFGVIAGMAGANNIYVFNPKININEKHNAVPGEFAFNLNIIGSLPYEVLPNLNILLKNTTISLKDEKTNCLPLRNFVISSLPLNLDFLGSQDPDIKTLKAKKIPVLNHNPEDQRLDLYQHLSHIVLKRCYKHGIDIFRSKILLVGHGTFLNTTLSLLKSLGAMVYVCNTGLPFDQTYVLKHLKDIDVIIAMDYPKQEIQVIGSKGVIEIGDIVDLSPFVRILHISGEIETGSLKLGGIRYYPDEINQESLNVSINELGERGQVEIAVNCLKLAENYLKIGSII